jgi:NAD(P)-dependent dehydrogenase (short-subunit alcohol dehydrogenase family)
VSAVTVEQFSVGDRTAIVTGASSGIGRTIAERFTRESDV